MAFMNTLVTRGRGEIVVTQTGGSTAMGRISKELAMAGDSPSPLQVQLDVLGKRLGGIALALVGLLGFLEYLRSVDLAHALLDAIALAVAAVPEGLPAVVTVTLALGMHRMAQQRAIIKRLDQRRNARLNNRNLLRQNRHADAQSDDCACPFFSRPAFCGIGGRLWQ